jgi:hypothetical protein
MRVIVQQRKTPEVLPLDNPVQAVPKAGSSAGQGRRTEYLSFFILLN